MCPQQIGVDQAGFIQKTVAATAIHSPYDMVTSSIVEYLRIQCALYLHSAYLAGSIPAGTATVGRSDIDITLVVQDAPASQLQTAIGELRQRLLSAYSFLPKVDIVSGLYTEVTAPENRYGWGFWFQHCCACIYGKDIGQQIEPFRPSWKLVYGLNGDIKQYNDRVKRTLLACSDDEQCTTLCRSIARKYIRSAFCLVSVPEESYTDNLDICASLFLRHYPAYAAILVGLLGQARYPTAHATEMVRVLETFGVWLEDQYAAVLQL